jgi:hypothetical protein
MYESTIRLIRCGKNTIRVFVGRCEMGKIGWRVCFYTFLSESKMTEMLLPGPSLLRLSEL